MNLKELRKCRAAHQRAYYKTHKKKVLGIIRKYFKSHPWAQKLIGIRTRCTNQKQYSWEWYGGKGIRCLLTNEEVKTLWLRDRAHDLKHPAIDRINPNDHYTFKNCRFIEASENSRRIKRRAA